MVFLVKLFNYPQGAAEYSRPLPRFHGLLSLSLLCFLFSCAFTQDKPSDKPFFDQLTLSDGGRLEGIVTHETPQQVRFQFLIRKPGVRTLVFETLYDRSEIASISKAKEPGRTLAREMIAGLESRKKLEETKVQALPMLTTPWITGKGMAHRYVGPYFELISDADEQLVRLVAVRLDAIFAAYVNTLGKRQQPTRPVRILLFHTMKEYRDWQQRSGMQILNPAVYDAKSGEILVGTDLEQQALQLKELTAKHHQQLEELTDLRKKVDKHYSGQAPAILARKMQQDQLQLHNLIAENEATFARLQAGFFATLYHEAFHAYLDQWVFPATRYHVPRWLNEGLAQLFESAFIEINELRVGRIDEKRLADIQDTVTKGRFMTIREILQAPAQQFFVRHTQESFEADRQYNASWALAHFLTYELKLLTSQAMVEYVSSSQTGEEVKRFEKLTGMSLEQCEQRWKTYLLRLRTDGSLRP